MTKPFLIFLDIDGTLIQENQRPNTKHLPSVIQKLEQKGFVFGLNSNRSFEDIQSVYNEFGLNGPVVLENGVYFKKKLHARRVFLARDKSRLRADIVRFAKAFVAENDIDAEVSIMDTVAVISSGKQTKGVRILINKFRLYTGSIHVYRDGVRDRDLAEELATYLRKKLKTAERKVDVIVTGEFGNIIINPKGVSKRTAFKKLRSFYPDHSFVMIGDDAADAKTLQEVDHFFAVGNAADEARKVAEYVAKETHTKGVIETLKYMEKKHVVN